MEVCTDIQAKCAKLILSYLGFGEGTQGEIHKL